MAHDDRTVNGRHWRHIGGGEWWGSRVVLADGNAMYFSHAYDDMNKCRWVIRKGMRDKPGEDKIVKQGSAVTLKQAMKDADAALRALAQ